MMMNRARGLLGQIWRLRRRRRCQDGVYVATTSLVRPTHTITPRTYMHTRRLFLTDVLLILLRTICGATHSPTHAPVATRPRSWFNVTFCGAHAARQCNFKLCLQCGERPNYTISFCSARTYLLAFCNFDGWSDRCGRRGRPLPRSDRCSHWYGHGTVLRSEFYVTIRLVQGEALAKNFASLLVCCNKEEARLRLILVPLYVPRRPG